MAEENKIEIQSTRNWLPKAVQGVLEIKSNAFKK